MSFQLCRLGELCEIRSGGTPSRAHPAFFGGHIPWAKIGDLERAEGVLSDTEEKITDAGLGAIRGKIFEEGTLLFAIYGSIGKMAFTTCRAATNQAILGLSFHSSSRVAPRFVYYWLKANNARLLGDGQGIAQKNLSAAYLRELAIPLPPLNEQRRIAAILDKADALRRKRKRALDLFDGLTQSTFQDMFRDRDDPVTRLQDAVRKGTIVTYGIVQAGPEFPGGVPYIRTGDLVDGRIQADGLRRTDPAIAAHFNRSRVSTGDIVMSIRATVGTTAIVPPELDGANLTQGTARIVPGERLTREYLVEYIRSSEVKNWIAAQIKGATFLEITLGRLRELPIRLPPLDLQKRFTEVCEKVNLCRSLCFEGVADAQKLFSSLQHRAFSGQL